VASFTDVRVWCLPFPTRNAPIENYIDWFEEELMAVSGTVWKLNDNFDVLAIEGVLNMLRSAGCQDLPRLCKLAMSSDV
jgi:hypothetical protein